MVRFSDIIKKKDKKEPPRKLPENDAKEDGLRLSDSPISTILSDSQLPKASGYSISAGPPSTDNRSLEGITYYEKFLEKAMDIRERVKNDQGISPSPILSDLHYIINNNLVENLYEYTACAPDDYDEVLVHTVEITFACLKVGKGMGYDTKMLLKLGLAAFLENVGMYKIPDSIIKKKGKLGEREIRIIREHPRRSSEILGRMGERYKWLAEVVLQVHERADGSGYPNGLKGKEIHELASIIGLMDTYTAMIKNRAYRDKFVPSDAMKFIIKDSKNLFQPKILKVFLNLISLFPVNTYVRLNDKSIGRVISTDKNQPLRPTIELLYNGLGNKLEEWKVIRLPEHPLLYITESIDEKELPQKK